MVALTLALLAAAPDAPAAPDEPPPAVRDAPGLTAGSRAQLELDYARLQRERPSLKLPLLITGGALLGLALGAELLFGAWGWSRVAPSGAWNQASVRYLTASGSGYALAGLTVSITGVYLLVRTVRERRAADVQLEELERLLARPGPP